MAMHARSGPVSVAGKGVRVRRLRRDEGVAEAHRRFGDLDIPARLAGSLYALGPIAGGLPSGISDERAVPAPPDPPPAPAQLHEPGPSR
jgi:hypothetical protein